MESIVPEKDVAELDAKQLEEELNKNVGVAVDYSTMTRNNLFKFLIFSAIGVWVILYSNQYWRSQQCSYGALDRCSKGAVGIHRYELDGPDFVYRAFCHVHHLTHSKGWSHSQVP